MFPIFFIFTKNHFLSEKIVNNLELLDSLRKLHVFFILNTLKLIFCLYEENLEHLNVSFRIFFVYFKIWIYKWTPHFLNEFSEAIFFGKNIFFLHRCSFYVLNFPFQVLHIRICEILSNLINLKMHHMYNRQ